MNPPLAAGLIAGTLFAAMFLGMRIRRRLPEHHLHADTRDVVKLSVGLVATMSALVLGLLVSSAKSSYDTTRNEVIQMAAKIAFLDRVLAAYGPEASGTRSQFRAVLDRAIGDMWTAETAGKTAWNTAAGDAAYASLQSLPPRDDFQRSLKEQASSLVVELGQLRTLLWRNRCPPFPSRYLPGPSKKAVPHHTERRFSAKLNCLS